MNSNFVIFLHLYQSFPLLESYIYNRRHSAWCLQVRKQKSNNDHRNGPYLFNFPRIIFFRNFSSSKKMTADVLGANIDHELVQSLPKTQICLFSGIYYIQYIYEPVFVSKKCISKSPKNKSVMVNFSKIIFRISKTRMGWKYKQLYVITFEVFSK